MERGGAAGVRRADFPLTVAYVGSGTSYIMEAYNWNGSDPGPVATEAQPAADSAAGTTSPSAVPYGHSTYHGMDVQLEKRYAAGLSFSTSYTWSHSLDNVSEQFGSGGGGLQSSTDFDRRRAIRTSTCGTASSPAAVWEMPFGKGRRWMNRGACEPLLGGWQLSGMTSMQTGHYFTHHGAEFADRCWAPRRWATGGRTASAIRAWTPAPPTAGSIPARSCCRATPTALTVSATPDAASSTATALFNLDARADEEFPADRALRPAIPLGDVQRDQYADAGRPERCARQPGFRQSRAAA